MGLFDKFRSARTVSTSGADSDPAAEQDALRLIDEGNAIEEAGQIAEALQRYDAAIRRAPHLARAYLNRGNALLEMSDHEGALEAYATALSKNPQYAAAHYNSGNAYARSGRPAEAVAAYRRAIALKPDFADAEVRLGSTLEDLGQLDEAIARYQRALAIRPDYPEVHRNLGLALGAQGRSADAVASFRNAVEIDPGYVAGYAALGKALQDIGQPRDALACYLRVAELQPASAAALGSVADLQRALGQLDESIASLRRASAVDPAFHDTHFNLGRMLHEAGQPLEAVASYQRYLDVAPNSAEAHNNLANVLSDLCRFDDAIKTLRRGIAIDSSIADLHFNLGNALCAAGYLHDAVGTFRRALELNPRLAGAHCNLGNALHGIGHMHDALASYRHTVQLTPDDKVAHCNLGTTLTDLGHDDEGMASFREALRIDPEYSAAQSNLLFALNYRPDADPATMREEAARYGNLVARQARPFTAWPNDRDPARRVRVGFVSGDLRGHAVGRFLEGVLAALASTATDRPEIFAYATHFVRDAVTERIRASCSGWHSAVGQSDEKLAQRIRDDRIDILIDVSGHTAHNRLPMFAWKPAPVQATWLGYLATTGVAAIDYLIADPWTLPESEEVNFTEKIWRLPESYLCFTPRDSIAQGSPLPALANRHVTFGSFNNLTKVNDEVVALWARVLKQVPDSQLFLKSKQFEGEAVRARMIERFGAHRIDAGRLVLAGFAPMADYLAPFQDVDISLDPFPYPGITTSVESLSIGVPVLTLAGKSFLARQGVGLMMNAGLPEWIAEDADDYVARAVALSSDRQRLASLRSELPQRVRSSPIFDNGRFADRFAAALRGMWQEWCRRQTSADTPR